MAGGSHRVSPTNAHPAVRGKITRGKAVDEPVQLPCQLTGPPPVCMYTDLIIQIFANSPFRRRTGFLVALDREASADCSRLPGRLPFPFLLSAISSVCTLTLFPPHRACAVRSLDEWQATPPTCASTMTLPSCPTFPP